jgi:hypothetical protein
MPSWNVHTLPEGSLKLFENIDLEGCSALI